MKQTPKRKKTSVDNVADEMAALFEFTDEASIDDRSELTPSASRDEITKVDFEYADEGKLSGIQAIVVEQKSAKKDAKKASNENKTVQNCLKPFNNVQNRSSEEPKPFKTVQPKPFKTVQKSVSVADLRLLDFLCEQEAVDSMIFYQWREIGLPVGKTADGARASAHRLRSAGFMEWQEVGRGKSSGGVIPKVLEPGLRELARPEIRLLLSAKPFKTVQNRSAKTVQNRSMMIDDINKSSSGSNDDVPEHIRQVQLSEAHKIGVYLTHKLIAETGSHLPTAKIQEMLSHFVFEYRRKGKDLCENPIGYFRKALANGDYRKPKGYRSPDTKSATVPTDEPTDASAEDLMKKWEAFCKTEEGQRFKETVGSGALPAWLKSEQAKAKQKSLEKL